MSNKKPEESQISKELKRYENQIKEIQDALESIKLMEIENIEERLKATVLKENALKNLQPLLLALEEMRNKNKLTQDNIKGSKILSPLEDGTLD